MNEIIISVIESGYIIYMYNYFKTTYNIAHSLSYFIDPLLYHPIGTQEHPENLICPLGNMGSYIIAGYLIGRHFIPGQYWKRYNKYIMTMILLMTLMNFNATLYFMPLFITELILY